MVLAQEGVEPEMQVKTPENAPPSGKEHNETRPKVLVK